MNFSETAMHKLLTVAVLLGILAISFVPSESKALTPYEALIASGDTPAVITQEYASQLIAAGSGAAIANLMCATFTYVEVYRFCYDVTFGIPTPGMCIGTATCLGLGTLAITGAAIGIGKGIVGSIMSGQQQPNMGGTTGYGATNTGGCSSFRNVTTPSSNPCDIYLPSSTGLQIPRDTTNLINNSLNTGSSNQTNTGSNIFGANTTNTSGTSNIPGGFGSSNSNSANPLASSGIFGAQNSLILNQASPGTAANPTAPNPPIIFPGNSSTKGDIYVNYTGATIRAGVRDAERNIEFVAFFGASVPRRIDPQFVVARMCSGQPWMNRLISYVIPYPLFDRLCTEKKLAFGLPLPPPPPPPPPPKIMATSTAPVIPPKVDIWAVPPSVSSGARTSIFWSATGVTGCDERSSDGQFHGDTISGNSSSAPLATTTVFAISCLTAGNERVSNFVEVKVR